MKTGALVILPLVLASMVAATAAHAEEATQLPPTTVIGTPPSGASAASTGAAAAPVGTGAAADGGAHERCVDVTAGGERSFGCINQMLKNKVDKTNPPTMNTPPIDAKSSDLKTGVVNIPGVQQQYGQNFGKSAVPYRPPPAVFGSPIGGRR
jgi:hypothetical protein